MTTRPSVAWLACVALGIAGCATTRPPSPVEALCARRLMVPVAGIAPAAVPDVFNARRDDGRMHGAVDIPAPRGTPVLAADDGRVLRLHRNRKGGLTLYATDPSETFVYYYAHLDAYREGMRKGTPIHRGDVLGAVGTTGNADRREPHLHFQVMTRPGDGRWWDGAPVDPRTCFANAGRARASR